MVIRIDQRMVVALLAVVVVAGALALGVYLGRGWTTAPGSVATVVQGQPQQPQPPPAAPSPAPPPPPARRGRPVPRRRQQIRRVRTPRLPLSPPNPGSGWTRPRHCSGKPA